MGLRSVLIIDLRLAEIVRKISSKEKQTVVTAKVPPNTIRRDCKLTNDFGEPPKYIAAPIREKAPIKPMTVAKSKVFVAGVICT